LANGAAGSGLWPVPEDDVTDDDLMAGTARGEEAAFRQLVQRWEGPIFAFLQRMLDSPEDALDLSQETFLRVHAQARRYEPAGRFRGWLFRIAGNLARSWLRRKRTLRWIRFDPARHDQPSSHADAARSLERQETRRQVRDALARLPDRQRQAVLLRRYEGLGYSEIATALGTTVPAVESLLQRAMARLRKDLAGKVVDG
jgi:RNA polymerase sigma-70 factor (ECF subfamily)